MSIERVAPEHIKVSDSETALKVTQSGSGNAFVVEDSESPDSSAFVVDNQGRVGVKKTPTQDLDVDGTVSATSVVTGYATTATSSGTTTLTATSAQQQFFTGSQGHTVVLPVASTLVQGQYFTIHNNSTGALVVNSSGGNLVKTLGPSTTAQLTCIVTSGTDASSWDVDTAEGSAFALTTTDNGTLTLSVSSAQRQFFEGTQNQTVVLPAVNTLTLGQFYIIENNSSGAITVQSSGLNEVVVVASNRSVQLTALATSGTGASVWDVEHGGASTPLATTAYVDTSISDLINEAPGALDTLNELAAALGDDENFATTVTNSLAGKVDNTGDTITGEVVISANTSGDALRVTQTGSGDPLRVEDEANPDSTPFIVKTDGSVGVGTDSPTEKLSVVGDISATGGVISDELSSSIAQEVLSEAVFYIDATQPGFDSNKVQNLGTAGSILDATLGSTATADSNDPKYLEWDGTNYVYLSGINGNYMSVPDENALDITGDIDIRVHMAADDWTPDVVGFPFSKWNTNNQSWFVRINTGGNVRLYWSTDGTDVLNATSTVPLSVNNGEDIWLRVTLDVDNGSSGYDVDFYTSADGEIWNQLGTTVTGGSVTSIHASTKDVEFGSVSGGAVGVSSGKYYQAQIFNGIDGVKVLDIDTSAISSGSDTSFTALTGQTVTINRSTSGRKTVAVTQPTYLFGTDDYMEVPRPAAEDDTYVRLTGASGSYLSVPDEAALDITGDIDIRAYVALDDWTPEDEIYLVNKRQTSSTRSFALAITKPSNGTGKLRFFWSENGSTFLDEISTTTPTISDGSPLWVRATLDVDNGASGHDVKFFTSQDGVSWSQLGSTKTTAGTTNIYSSTSQIELGSASNGSVGLTTGKVYRAQILDGIDGTTVLDVDSRYALTGDTTFRAATGQTVTVNGDASIVESAYASALDFGADDSFTLVAVIREWATPTNNNGILSKRRSTNGYLIRQNGTTLNTRLILDDGTNFAAPSAVTAWSSGDLITAGAVLDRDSQVAYNFANGVSSSTADTASLGSVSNNLTFRVGRLGDSLTSYSDMEFIAAAVIRRALTPVEIAALNNYFQNRPPLGESLVVKAATLEVQGNVEVTGSGNRFVGSGAVYNVTSTTRPANPVEGDVIYERDTKLFYGWDGSLWKSIGGGAKGGGNDDVFYENSQVVTVDYSITTSKNAMTSGPVSINPGITVTVPSGSVWTIV